MSWQEKEWVRLVSLSLKVALAGAGVYLAWVFFERSHTHWAGSEQRETRPLQDDLYVVPPRSNVTTLRTARAKLIGRKVWTREGWRRGCDQDDRLLGPLEAVTIEDFVEHNSQVWARVTKDGRPCDIAVAANGVFYFDDVFFVEDPVVTYDRWTEEDWNKIRDHVVEPGMSYFQVGFSLGFGRIVGGQCGDCEVIYGEADGDGLETVRVTYERFEAMSVRPLGGG